MGRRTMRRSKKKVSNKSMKRQSRKTSRKSPRKSKKRKAGKKASAWNKYMMSVYREMKKKNKDVKLGAAMKEAAKTYTK